MEAYVEVTYDVLCGGYSRILVWKRLFIILESNIDVICLPVDKFRHYLKPDTTNRGIVAIYKPRIYSYNGCDVLKLLYYCGNIGTIGTIMVRQKKVSFIKVCLL